MHARTCLLLLIATVAMAACEFTPGTGADNGGDDGAVVGFDAPLSSSADAATSPDGRAPTPSTPGGACSCDADCASEGANAGVCIYGVCMTRAAGACPSGGSTQGCPAGSRCWNLSDTDEVGPLCWPDCASHTCSGTCDSDQSCAPAEGGDCDPACGAACSCTPTSCPTGEMCVGGTCVEQMSGGPGAGPGPACPGLPARDCTGATCGQLVSFSPRTSAAWDDYPINGETAGNQYRSFLRRDLQMLVAYATSKVACKTAAWSGGNGGALGLGDMSEANGAIPGTSIGQPGHPANTHVSGYDIDLAYYQTGTANNQLRPICAFVSGGVDQNHCVAAPDKLDVWRTALFLGAIFESTRTRVIGVDGQAGPLLMSAISQLCSTGWLEGAACNNLALAYETTDMNLGWFRFHHHHAHISLKRASLIEPTTPHGCAADDCVPTAKSRPGRSAGVHRLR